MGKKSKIMEQLGKAQNFQSILALAGLVDHDDMGLELSATKEEVQAIVEAGLVHVRTDLSLLNELAFAFCGFRSRIMTIKSFVDKGRVSLDNFEDVLKILVLRYCNFSEKDKPEIKKIHFKMISSVFEKFISDLNPELDVLIELAKIIPEFDQEEGNCFQKESDYLLSRIKELKPEEIIQVIKFMKRYHMSNNVLLHMVNEKEITDVSILISALNQTKCSTPGGKELINAILLKAIEIDPKFDIVSALDDANVFDLNIEKLAREVLGIVLM